ncbi:hypothetical protein SS50377_23366 [Spironucleus salmonicida]|uniref:Uncharacterized protein n=1 Tax=Spironucleus salmonicida TaxID=348837 RepID=V6LRF8_9EUKA|nr:hypothetical protein SS50377_23366 [Spironucleus salmonicida]|eukprot:EST47237.1 Hypothetical protein SS50377_12747 [Spironucleus salmonicida]
MKGMTKNQLQRLKKDIENVNIVIIHPHQEINNNIDQQRRRRKKKQQIQQSDTSQVRFKNYCFDATRQGAIQNQNARLDQYIDIQANLIKQNFQSETQQNQILEKIKNITVSSPRRSNKLNSLAKVVLCQQKKEYFVRNYQLVMVNRKDDQSIKVLEPSFYIAASSQLRTIGFQEFMLQFCLMFPEAKKGTGTLIKEEQLEKIQFSGFQKLDSLDTQVFTQKGKQLVLENINILIIIFGNADGTSLQRYINLMKWQNSSQTAVLIYLQEELISQEILHIINQGLTRMKIKQQ